MRADSASQFESQNLGFHSDRLLGRRSRTLPKAGEDRDDSAGAHQLQALPHIHLRDELQIN